MSGPAVLAAVLLVVGPVWAAPTADLHEWPLRRPLSVPASPAEFAEVSVDGALYDQAAPSFRDVRIVSAQGALLPHVVQDWPGSTSEETVSARMLNRSVLPGRLTRIEFEAGATRVHNRIRLDIDGGAFSRRVTVEGGDDRRNWFTLASSRITRSPEQRTASVTIIYPDSTYRYVRLSVLDRGEPPLPVRGAALIVTRMIPAREDVWYDGPIAGTTDAAARSTTAIIDLGHRNLPISHVALTVDRPESFARTVVLATSDDRESWNTASSARLVREPGRGPATPLTLSFAETSGRYVRITVVNGDNPPLELRRVAVAGIRRTILFPTAGGGRYWLYVGYAAAPSPDYDLPQVLQLRAAPPRPVPAVMGPVEPNPAYAPPIVRRPWTEERPWLLWGALGLSIIVILLVIATTVRGTRATS
jgi:hypothetical protein